MDSEPLDALPGDGIHAIAIPYTSLGSINITAPRFAPPALARRQEGYHQPPDQRDGEMRVGPKDGERVVFAGEVRSIWLRIRR